MGQFGETRQVKDVRRRPIERSAETLQILGLFREQIEERLKEMNPMNVPMNGSSHLTHEAAISGEATWPIRRQVPRCINRDKSADIPRLVEYGHDKGIPSVA